MMVEHEVTIRLTLRFRAMNRRDAQLQVRRIALTLKRVAKFVERQSDMFCNGEIEGDQEVGVLTGWKPHYVPPGIEARAIDEERPLPKVAFRSSD